MTPLRRATVNEPLAENRRLRAQIAAITTARIESDTAWAERVRELEAENATLRAMTGVTARMK